MPTFNGTNPVTVGFATKKEHYDRAFDNILALYNDHTSRQTFHGLHLRTHPDTDLAATRVLLARADEIVTNNGGFRTTNWNDLAYTANIAASGAGGLDTGSPVNSAWYEIHAIRKSSDATQNLIFHRAPYREGSQAASTEGTPTKLRDASARTKLGQSFSFGTPSENSFLRTVAVKLQKAGTPTGRIWAEIYEDSAGSPSSVLAASDKIDVSKINTAASQWVIFTFRIPYGDTGPNTKWLLLAGDYTISAANYVQWEGHSASSYASGLAKTFDGATWSTNATTLDHVFQINQTRGMAALTFPSGYDQSALIGMVYRDSGGNFIPFVQQGRYYQPLAAQATSGITSTVALITDLGALLPHRPVRLHAAISNTAAGNQVALSPGTQGLGAAASVTHRQGGVALGYSVTTVNTLPQVPLAPVLIEEQYGYVWVSAGTGVVYVEGWEW